MDALLEPPRDFGTDLPVCEVPARRWYRVHQRAYSALYFDPKPSFRFNAPSGEFGVLYMSEAPEGAFAEALVGGRTRPPMLMESQLARRALTAFTWRALMLADFTGLGLSALGLDARIASADCYPLSRRWAAWIHAHPRRVDGICYFARNAPSLRSVALFERAGLPLDNVLLEPALLVQPGLLGPWGKSFVDTFQVAVLPG